MRRFEFVLRGSAAIGVTLILIAPALAVDIPATRASLKGLKAVHVVVEKIAAEVEESGFTANQLQTDIELRLRQIGIRVDESAREFLLVRVNTVYRKEVSLYALAVEVSLNQTARLTRDSSIIVCGPTWSTEPWVGTVGSRNLRDVRQFVIDGVDEFLNAYLEQNPKR